MNILGKVFLWLSVVMAAVSIYLTTMLLDIRQKWLTEVEQRQAKVEESVVQLADARRRVRTAEESRQQLVHDWGELWSAQARLQPGGTGAMEVSIGSDAGLPQKAEGSDVDPAVYVFAENAGQVQYLGEFRVSAIRPDRAVLQPSRPPAPQEVATWPQAANVHIRGTLPHNWLTVVADLDAQQVVAQTNLETQQLQLEILNKQIAASQQALDQRLAELNGDPEAPPGASQEVVNGLVQTLRLSDSARNEKLGAVDALRQELDATYVRLMQTLEANRSMTRSLQDSQTARPSAGETSSAASSSAASVETSARP